MRTEHTITDKSKWKHGCDEPDKIEFIDPETDMACLMVRHGGAGHWCGYVGVESSHPMYEVSSSGDFESSDVRALHELSVHGGITFTDKCKPEAHPSEGVCHVPFPGRTDDIWWIGFDCAHTHDVSPLRDSNMQFEFATYKSQKYVENQIRQLAVQLKEAA